MAPLYLPRVGAFPIFAEDSLVVKAGTGAQLPLSIKKNFPLKDKFAPGFVLSDQFGNQCSLHDTMKLGRPIILFFFPLAGSPHCTLESCLFRDAIEVTPVFSVLQAIVIGISQDPPERAKKFTAEHKLSYPILYDHKRKIMDLYGVGRTTFGLVDNRATFIIDPSGIVRGLAEGVLNARGHLKFAEKWLIRLEDELSERSKQYHEYAAKEGDMIANIDSGTARVVKVVYGDEGSAPHGGLDGFPRYGAASVTPAKQPVSPNARGRKSTDHLEKPSRGRTTEMRKSGESNGQEKNMWKNWRYLLSQLSSPDDVPPPIVYSRSSFTRSRNNSESTSKTERETDSPNTSPRSSQPNPTRTLSRRRAKSPFGKRSARKSDSPPPPVPQMTPPRNGMGNGIEIANEDEKSRKPWIDPLDADAEDVRAAGWEADHSIRNSSISSTPPSSFSHARLGSQSSSSHTACTTNPLVAVIANGSSNGHGNVSLPQPKPVVTSEILMADGPTITRRTSRKLSSPPASPLASQVVSQRSNGMTQPLISTTLEQTRSEQEDTEPRRSSGPSDVPEDAKPDEDELLNHPLPPLPKALPLPMTPTKQPAALPSLPLHWARGLGRRSASSDGRASPGSAPSKVRLGKKIHLPVTTSQHGPNSWDTGIGYGQESLGLSSDSDITIRPKHTSLQVNASSPPAGNGMHRSASALSRTGESSPNGDRSLSTALYPFGGRRSRTVSLVPSKGSEATPDSSSTPSTSSSGRGIATNLVLQSLANVSQHSLTRLDNSNTPLVTSLHAAQDNSQPRIVPRKAPPPSYALPQPPPASTQIISRTSSSQTITKSPPLDHEPLHASISRSSSGEGSPSNAYIYSFQGDSRRASAADSVRSTGTFG